VRKKISASATHAHVFPNGSKDFFSLCKSANAACLRDGKFDVLFRVTLPLRGFFR
jgi:hypothetical protein